MSENNVKFTEPNKLTDAELSTLIKETSFGRMPKSLSTDELKMKTVSDKQIQTIFNQKLSAPQTLLLMKILNVKDGVEKYQDHIKKGYETDRDKMPKKIQSLTQQATNKIDHMGKGFKID